MAHKAKTPLFAFFGKALNMALAANRENVSAEEIIQRTEATALSRQKFLENTGKTAMPTTVRVNRRLVVAIVYFITAIFVFSVLFPYLPYTPPPLPVLMALVGTLIPNLFFCLPVRE